MSSGIKPCELASITADWTSWIRPIIFPNSSLSEEETTLKGSEVKSLIDSISEVKSLSASGEITPALSPREIRLSWTASMASSIEPKDSTEPLRISLSQEIVSLRTVLSQLVKTSTSPRLRTNSSTRASTSEKSEETLPVSTLTGTLTDSEDNSLIFSFNPSTILEVDSIWELISPILIFPKPGIKLPNTPILVPNEPRTEFKSFIWTLVSSANSSPYCIEILKSWTSVVAFCNVELVSLISSLNSETPSIPITGILILSKVLLWSSNESIFEIILSIESEVLSRFNSCFGKNNPDKVSFRLLNLSLTESTLYPVVAMLVTICPVVSVVPTLDKSDITRFVAACILLR